MTIEFENLEFSTDKDKAMPRLEHDFRPFKEDPDLVIRCKYFQTGEMMNYMTLGTDNTIGYRFRDIFADQVISISGIEFKDKKTGKVTPITDAKTFLSFPSVGVFERILSVVSTHLIKGDGLTENEVKN